MNEVTGSWSYYGLLGADSGLDWKVNTTDEVQTFGKSWNGDYTIVGCFTNNFAYRGGNIRDEEYNGILAFGCVYGGASFDSSFRPTLAF